MAVIIGMVFGGTVGLVVCGVTAGVGWAMAVGDGLRWLDLLDLRLTCADECRLLGASWTVTNRCLPTSIYQYTA